MINQLTFDDATLRDFVTHSIQAETLSPWHITRYSMYRDLQNVLLGFDRKDAVAASISHSQQLAYVTGITSAEFVDVNYPEYNVLNLPFPDSHFDFAFADMVFEHIEGSPWDAYKEISRTLKPGGILVLTTVFAFPYHPCPGDFWRYTESGVRMFADRSGHQIMKSGSWGSLQVFILDRLGCADIKVPENPEHPLHRLAVTSDPLWPTTVWLVARKSA